MTATPTMNRRTLRLPTIRAELLTALSTPAAKGLLLASVVMAALSSTANLAAADELASDATVQLAMHASTVATLVFALLGGVYAATTDHRFGLIDQRLLSQPHRSRVLAAKAAVLGGVGFLYGVLGAVTGLAAASAFYLASDVPFDQTSPLVVEALLGVVVSAPLFAVIGVAVGMAARNQPMAIGGALAWTLIVEPTFLVGIPDIGAWLPGAAGLALTNSPDPALLGQLSGAVVLTSYAALATGIALWSFGRADV